MLLEQSISQTSAETKCNSFMYLFAHFCLALFDIKKNPSYFKWKVLKTNEKDCLAYIKTQNIGW